MIKTLEKTIKQGFNIKTGKNKTTLFINSEIEWTNFKEHLVKRNAEFYTFTDKTIKTHAFVLKGLPYADDNENEIIKDILTAKGIPVQKVFRMRSEGPPMYMVVTNSSVTLAKIAQIKTMNHVYIKWEKVINKKRSIQCHRCQEWGHATSNCHLPPPLPQMWIGAPVRILLISKNTTSNMC